MREANGKEGSEGGRGEEIWEIKQELRFFVGFLTKGAEEGMGVDFEAGETAIFAESFLVEPIAIGV